MKRFLLLFLACYATYVGSSVADAAPEIVVAIRYLQAEGTSHSQLYLYREDGTLIRQLTKNNSGQLKNPIFAPDGETIIFTNETKAGKEYWSIEPKGGKLHKLDTAPKWYAATKSSSYFTNEDPKPASEVSAAPAPKLTSDTSETPGPEHYLTPDGLQEVILKTLDSGEDNQNDGSGLGKHFQLRDVKSGETIEMGKLPGFNGLQNLLHMNNDPENHFLILPPLRVAFFYLHLNSTDGTTVFVLDLNGKRVARLSPNWAAPILLPDESAFLTFTELRYVPIPGSSKTANCSCVERWDVKLEKVRYASNPVSICYGASMYRPGKTPATITILNEPDR